MVSSSSTNNYCRDGQTEKYEIVYFYSYAPKLYWFSLKYLQKMELPEEDLQNSPESLVAGYNLKIKWNSKFPYPESRMKPREVQNALFWGRVSLFTDPLLSLQSPSRASLPRTTRARVIKYKPKEIYWPPAQGSSPMFLKRTFVKSRSSTRLLRLCTGQGRWGSTFPFYFKIVARDQALWRVLEILFRQFHFLQIL